MILEGRLFPFTGGHPDVPLAKVGRSVPSLLQYLGDRYFTLQEMHIVHVILQDTIDSRS